MIDYGRCQHECVADNIVLFARAVKKAGRVYIFHILNLDFVKEKLLTTVTGSSSTEIKWELIKDIPVPIPPNGDYDTFLADIMELESRISKYRSMLDEKSAELNQKFKGLFA